jgi:PAS domain S-box-containing protein
MTSKNKKISIKIKVILPVLVGIVLAFSITTIFSINNSKKHIKKSIEKYLVLEVETIVKMFEREKALKTDKVITGLKVAHDFFYSKIFEITDDEFHILATNQISLEETDIKLKVWKLDNLELHNDHCFVDNIQESFGGTATIFQKFENGYIRVSTNVINSVGERAIGTFIPNDSPVIETIEKGETYIGRAYVVNDWYITAYEPIYSMNEIIGILYVGYKEKDLSSLKTSLNKLKIGESGYTFVFDEAGKIIIHPNDKIKDISKEAFFNEIIQHKKGIYRYSKDNNNYAMAYEYFDDFKLYIATIINEDEETINQKNNIIISSTITAIVIILILSIFIIFITSKHLKKILTNIEEKDDKIKTTTQAIEQTENKFKILFDNTVDEIFVTDAKENIIEVNIAACNTLGYTRDELLSFKMQDIKPPEYAKKVSSNREKIYKLGKLTFESEHITKDGKLIQVEFKSRVIEYGNEKLILSISRTISERKKNERKILTAIIQTEERERERFSRDMHDGLGPLLSTIKLYVNEFNDEQISSEEKQKMIKYTNELIDEAVTSTRTISNNLMPRIILEYGLTKAIESFCNKINKTNKINITFTSKGIIENLEQNIQLIIFRVSSELINNTIKHAKAKNIIIQLSKVENKLFLNFSDDGVGFNVDEIMNNKQKGMGLKNIISRIKSINGNCNFNSNPQKGFEIDIDINI